MRARHLVICALASGALGFRILAPRVDVEKVTFKSLDTALALPIPAALYRPAGAGPFPALVALHGCDGPNTSNPWPVWLQADGFVVVEPNSLAPRGVTTTCASDAVPPRTEALDGLGALAYLRGRPDVLHDKIGVIGWSHGGAAALIAVAPRFLRTYEPAGGAFQAAVSMYPGCAAFPQNLATPLLLLLGSEDDWQVPTQCIERERALEAANAPIRMTVYAGATHAFDLKLPDRVFRLPSGVVHLRYDGVATADARRRVEAFFNEHLR